MRNRGLKTNYDNSLYRVTSETIDEDLYFSVNAYEVTPDIVHRLAYDVLLEYLDIEQEVEDFELPDMEIQEVSEFTHWKKV